MLIIIYIVSVLTGLVLQRQSERHISEELREYKRLGIEPPLARPKVQTIESMLTMWLGFIVSGLGLVAVWSFFLVPAELRQQQMTVVEEGAVFTAIGIALIMVGFTAVRQNAMYRKLRHIAA
jgi:hypothetical protein